MKSFVLFSILVSLNCLNFENIKISNTSGRVHAGRVNNTGFISSRKVFESIRKKCYNIMGEN